MFLLPIAALSQEAPQAAAVVSLPFCSATWHHVHMKYEVERMMGGWEGCGGGTECWVTGSRAALVHKSVCKWGEIGRTGGRLVGLSFRWREAGILKHKMQKKNKNISNRNPTVAAANTTRRRSAVKKRTPAPPSCRQMSCIRTMQAVNNNNKNK